MRGLYSLVVFALILMAAGFSSGADVQTISHGERVDIKDHLVPGKLTLIDFYADWCGPCRSLAPVLNRLADQHPDRFALRKIDISDSGAPAGIQYGVSAIPHLILFDEKGVMLREGPAGPVLGLLEKRLGVDGSSTSSRAAGAPVIPILFFGLTAAALFLYLRRGRAASTAHMSPPNDTHPSSRSATPSDDGIWFAMIQNSLEGPFSDEELERMLEDKVLAADARVRRRGDAVWHRLDDVVR